MVLVYVVSLIVMMYVSIAICIITNTKSIKVLLLLSSITLIPVINTICAILAISFAIYGAKESNGFK